MKQRREYAPRRRRTQVRSRAVTLALTPADYEFVDGASRRAGRTISRLLGDVIERWVDSEEVELRR